MRVVTDPLDSNSEPFASLRNVLQLGSHRKNFLKIEICAGDLVVVGSRAQLKPGTLVTPKLTTAGEGER